MRKCKHKWWLSYVLSVGKPTYKCSKCNAVRSTFKEVKTMKEGKGRVNYMEIPKNVKKKEHLDIFFTRLRVTMFIIVTIVNFAGM